MPESGMHGDDRPAMKVTCVHHKRLWVKRLILDLSGIRGVQGSVRRLMVGWVLCLKTVSDWPKSVFAALEWHLVLQWATKHRLTDCG